MIVDTAAVENEIERRLDAIFVQTVHVEVMWGSVSVDEAMGGSDAEGSLPALFVRCITRDGAAFRARLWHALLPSMTTEELAKDGTQCVDGWLDMRGFKQKVCQDG